MSLGDEISLNNTSSVPEATKDSDPGLVQKIRMQALAMETTARVELSKAEDAGKNAGSDSFSVLASAAVDAIAPGAKPLLTGGEFISARAADKHPLETPNVGEARAQTIDQGIVQSTARAPGLYSNAAATSTYGGNPKVAKDLSGNSSGVVEKANIASSSLVPPKDTEGLFSAGKKAFSGVACETNDKTLATTKLAKDMVFGNQIASKKALDSTVVWEKSYGAARGAAMGMGMGGPAANLRLAPRDIAGLMSEARDDQRTS